MNLAAEILQISNGSKMNVTSTALKGKQVMTSTNRSAVELANTIGNFTEHSNRKPNKKHKTGSMNKTKNTGSTMMSKTAATAATATATATKTIDKNNWKRQQANIPQSNANNKDTAMDMDVVYTDAQNSNIFDGNIADNDNENDEDDNDADDVDVGSNSNKNTKKQQHGKEFAFDANNNNNNNSNNINQKQNQHEHNVIILEDVADGDAETDSLASMETVSDNVAIWVDGERHWVSGVDANTTCTDLICALLNYQNGQQMCNHFDQQQQRQQQQQQQHHDPDNLNDYHGHRHEDELKSKRNVLNNNCITIGGINAINQSMPTTKEAVERSEEQEKAKSERTQAQPSQQSQCVQPVNSRAATTTPATTPTTMMMRMARCAALASEYVIVKQHRHCEEYLDGSTRVFDVLAAKAEGGGSGLVVPARKECELFLRRLAVTRANASSSSAAASPQFLISNTQGASLLSTDKDSGMGSPVGSSRSARFRRRKHKSTSTWLAQGNTLHPKATQRNVAALSGSGFSAVAAAALATNADDSLANERLVRIILAQDETIHRQLSLLREKERQISKIEEEKHRARERELGKNYLLETYLKGLDEAAGEADNDFDDGGGGGVLNDGVDADDDGEEIFIDEPYQRKPARQQHEKKEKVEKFLSQHEEQQQKQHHHSARHARHNNNKHSSHHHAAHPTRKSMDHHKKQFPATETEGCVGEAATANVNDAAAAGIGVTSGGNAVDNQQEIELQILWLEKVYALNKQLQREEESLLKLHAKIRKHQVRCAYQMKNDVLQQIDELDAKLALQCADICRVEDNLVTTSEQLQEKLDALEKLRGELQEAPAVPAPDVDAVEAMPVDIEIDKFETKPRKRKPIVEPSGERWSAALSGMAAVTNDVDGGSSEASAAAAAGAAKKSFDDADGDNEMKNLTNDFSSAIRGTPTVELVAAVVTPLTAPKKEPALIYETTALSSQLKPNYAISHPHQNEQLSAVPAASMLPATLVDKNTSAALPATNAKIVKKPMFEALAHNQLPMPLSTTTTVAPTPTPTPAAPATTASASTLVAASNRHVQPPQPHQQKLTGNGSISAYIGSISMPLKEATTIDISRLGTLV